MFCLLAVSIIMIVTSQTECSLATLWNTNLLEKPRKNVCDTDVCQHEADLILSAINNTVDPCQDFYGFVCGKWLLRNPIPDDQQSISSLHKSAERVTNDIGAILNTTIFKYKNQNATDKAIIFYKSCLREGKTGIKPLKAHMTATT
ncbi:neprilysin-2-like [Ixodes scapularis]|uniref:neprilysin-2-like n=1 Tax=Ixodes scapularis TaxID=6945 RepID=UPI001C383345|nr:neprilysin-2-like [Ixodes scapularis]